MMNTDKETAKLNRLFSQLTSAAQYQWFNDGTWFPQYLHGNPRGYDFYGGAGVPYSVGGLRTGDDEEQEDSIGVQLSLQHGEHHEERARRALRNLHARGVSQSALRRMQANILARLDHDFEISRTTPQHSHDVDVALTELYTTHPLLFDVSNLTHPPESRSSENSSSSVVELELEDEEDQRRIAASISSSSTGSARAQRPEREDFDDTIIDMKVLQI